MNQCGKDLQARRRRQGILLVGKVVRLPRQARHTYITCGLLVLCAVCICCTIGCFCCTAAFLVSVSFYLSKLGNRLPIMLTIMTDLLQVVSHTSVVLLHS